MKKKSFLLLAILLVAVIAGASFAYTQTSASVIANVSNSSSFAHVDTWDNPADWGKYNALPAWTPFEGTAGSITAGDLYLIDPRDYTGDLLVNLYLTNADELVHNYSFLNMQVQAYTAITTTPSYTPTLQDAYLTMSNGYASFNLPGLTQSDQSYVITIDDGSWYCIDGDDSPDDRSLSPSFYIEVKQR